MSKLKLVASLLTKDQEFQEAQAADARAAAEKAGVDLEVVFARNNSSLQAEQLYRAIHAPQVARPAAIVIQTVAGDGLPKLAQETVSAGIGWVLLNRNADYIDRLRAEHPKLPIGVVTVDQVAVGRLQGGQFRKLLPRGGTVLYLRGPADTSAAKERLQGVEEVVRDAGISLTILDGEWTEESGERAMTSWLRLSSSREAAVKVIAAQNDAMAVGARRAIVKGRSEWRDLPFIGCDGLPGGGQLLVQQKDLTATIIVQPTAGTAIQLVVAQLKTGASVPARTVLTPRAFPP